GIEQAGSQGAFPLGKPLRHGFHRCRKTAGLTNTQTKARHRELKDRTRSRMSHGGRAPYKYRQRESLSRAQPVDELSDEQQSGSVRKLESGDDIAVSNLSPTELDLQSRLEQSDHL